MAEFIKEALIKDDLVKVDMDIQSMYPTTHFTYTNKPVQPMTAAMIKEVIDDFKKLSADFEAKKAELEPKEEWVWVSGYKGTESDLKCRDFQYEIGKLHSMPEGERIEDCKSGFHMCKELKEVFSYYPIGAGHRYFEVQAHVRKRDLDKYGKEDPNAKGSGAMAWWSIAEPIRDKLAAKSIILTRELTIDEILAGTEGANWAPEYKKTAIDKGLTHARHDVETDTLSKLGFSEAFSRYIAEEGEYDTAIKVASQTDLSMDMKVLAIIRGL